MQETLPGRSGNAGVNRQSSEWRLRDSQCIAFGMRRPLFIALTLIGWSGFADLAALGQTLVGETISGAVVRHAPGPYPAMASLPAGAAVTIGVCFDLGAYCFVSTAEISGYVEGRLLVAEGRRMDEREAARWAEVQTESVGILDAAMMIVAWGDSLTAGAGAPPEGSYPAQAEALFAYERQVAGQGVGGQTSTEIATRMNGLPLLLRLDGDAVPAAGMVPVIERTGTPISRQGPARRAGTLCGVSGTLERATEPGDQLGYVFRRLRTGEPVPCPAGSVFRFTEAEQFAERVQWLWMGTNGSDAGRTVLDDIAAAVESFGHERFLIGGVLSATNHSAERRARTAATNATLAQRYGARFVDLSAALAAGADGSDEDAADVAAAFVPRSLRVDELHLNARGYGIVARAFHDATLALGF